MKKSFTKLALIGLAVATVLAFGACSKYKGFKKTKSGIYYQFHGDIHDTAISPRTGDLVGVFLTLRAGDSTLFGPLPNEMPMDSLYEGDMFEAFRMMHEGDSATFIFDGPKFFETMMEQEYPFGEDPLYLEVFLYGVMPKAEYEKMKAEYDAKLEVSKEEEKGKIDEYLEKNPGLKLQPTGVYVKTVKKGTGDKVEPLQTVKVHYTGRFVDGTVFDSSDDDEPFEFTVGSGQVIPGWDAVVSTMKVGDKVTVLIPSEMAYREGRGAIPPYSPLVFDIELLEIVK